MTPSCSAALELATMLCGLEPDSEVLLPSYTFVSTANCIMRAGARPVFVDIRPDTLNIDEKQIESALTPRTRAIIPVHYAGVGCEMDAIMALADKHGLVVIEDAAQAVNSYKNGRALGSIGHLGAFSFHETKNYTCGEGGALCINKPELERRAEIIRDKGTNRQEFFRGEVDKYTWVEVGSSFVPSEICTAFLCAQLEAMEEIAHRRKRIYEFYTERLAPLEQGGSLCCPFIPEDCQINHHMIYILLENEKTRSALIEHLKERNIHAVFHYVPLHSSPMGESLGFSKGMLPETESVSQRLLRLPMFYEITEEEQSRVVAAISSFFGA